MLARAAVLLLLIVPLAGCADGEAESDPDPLDVRPTDTTGIIRGVVVDAAIVPVPDATVTLTGAGATATTDANGTFALGGLEPGAYPLRVARDGYYPLETVTTVQAGVADPPLVRVQLERDLTASPYVTAYQWDGYIQCGLSLIAACGVLDIVGLGEDRFITTHEVDRDPAWIQSEMVWESSQPVSDELWIWHSYSSKEGDFNGSFGWAQGPSPVLLATHADDLNQYGNSTEWRDLGTRNDLSPRVFSGSIEGTRGPGGCYTVPSVVEYCGGVGFTVEQQFTVFTHVFYRYTPPEGWRFSEDSRVPGA